MRCREGRLRVVEVTGYRRAHITAPHLRVRTAATIWTIGTLELSCALRPLGTMNIVIIMLTRGNDSNMAVGVLGISIPSTPKFLERKSMKAEMT